MLFNCIDNEHHIRKFFHMSETFKIRVKLLFLSQKHQCFFFGKKLKLAILFHLLNDLKFSDRFFHSRIVSQHTTKPSCSNVRHTCSLGMLFNRLSCLFFCSYEKYCLPFSCGISYNIICILEISKCFLKVNNIDILSCSENEFLHFWIPSSCLVPEVYSTLE